MNYKKKNMVLKLATIFSGIGAVEHALERLEIEYSIEFACDIDKYCKQTYFANFNIEEENWHSDIKFLDANKYKNKIDILVGGSPCQSFSTVGKRKGLDDDRGNLFFEFIRVLNETKPKVFIFENVKGLLSHNSGKTWETLEKELEKTGYYFYKKVLNSKNYGIPQNRERLFVVGFKEKTQFEFPTPIPLTINVSDLLLDNHDIKYYLSEKVKKYVLATGTGGFYSKPQVDLEVARPLLSTMAKMHRAGVDNYYTRGDRLRKLTPRECLRLMGFSDNFKIVVSDTQVYKQAGNSIVVDVLVNILRKIYE